MLYYYLQWLLQYFYLVKINFSLIFLILLLNKIELNISDLNYTITDINYFENDKDILYFTNFKFNCYSKFKNKKFKNTNIFNLEENNKKKDLNIKNVTFESIRKTFIFNLFVIVLTILVLIWDLFPNIFYKLINYFISDSTFENINYIWKITELYLDIFLIFISILIIILLIIYIY